MRLLLTSAGIKNTTDRFKTRLQSEATLLMTCAVAPTRLQNPPNLGV
jgi:hypothetical protein